MNRKSITLIASAAVLALGLGALQAVDAAPWGRGYGQGPCAQAAGDFMPRHARGMHHHRWATGQPRQVRALPGRGMGPRDGSGPRGQLGLCPYAQGQDTEVTQ
jgi:hypothetical protein